MGQVPEAGRPELSHMKKTCTNTKRKCAGLGMALERGNTDINWYRIRPIELCLLSRREKLPGGVCVESS